MISRGIDVSAYQGAIDWNEVKSSGVECAIIRAGYGQFASQKDPYFDVNVKGAKAAEIKIGAYWYGYARSVSEAVLEADVCAEVIKGITFELPVFYDYEYDSFRYAEESGITVTKAMASDFVIAFLERMSSKGYRVGNYVSPELIRTSFDDRISRFDTWIADYENNPNLSKEYTLPGFRIIGWQYTSEGRVAGITGNVSLDVFYTDKATVNPDTSAGLTAGREISLNNTSLYQDAYTSVVAAKKTGIFYLWSSRTVNGRIRITNAPDRVGVANQVTGWINVADIGETETGSTALKKGDMVRVLKNEQYDGKPFKVWYKEYEVLENPVNDRVVIGVDGVVTAAVKASNLQKI